MLGHEISGIVTAVGERCDPSLLGRAVIVPAVLPCGECDLCRAGFRSICRAQVMPGNDRDGGYASHVVVPARFLCPVPEALLANHELWELAVVSDALSTPFQAVKRSGLRPVSLRSLSASAASACTVCRWPWPPARRRGARRRCHQAGAGVGRRRPRHAQREGARREGSAQAGSHLASGIGAPPHLWKIFETSGTKAGQEVAFAFLGFGASLAIVGFTPTRVEMPLSNLMAFDADRAG